MYKSDLETAKSSSLKELYLLFNTSNLFVQLYSQAMRMIRSDDCQKMRMTPAEAARDITIEAFRATRSKIERAASIDAIPKDLFDFLKRAVGTKSIHYGSVDTQNPKVWQQSNELIEEVHDKVAYNTQPFSEEYAEEAFNYLCNKIRLTPSRKAILREIIFESYDKKQLAIDLGLTEVKVQQQRDYLKLRLKELEKEEPILVRLNNQRAVRK
jgi:hypothetical protein